MAFRMDVKDSWQPKERMIAMNRVKALNDIREQVDFMASQACGAVDDDCENCVFDAGEYCLFIKLNDAISEVIIDEAARHMQKG